MRPELTPRRRWVLKHIVEEYVTSATPVSSETVARRAPVRVSTATVRNDMAALEELGLVRQPHTSAGRVPSDAGYRLYVNELMRPADLEPAELRTIYHQFHQVEFAIDEWLALARAVLAQAVHSAAVVTPPLAPRARVRRIELVPLHDGVVLLVVLLPSGHIRQQVVPLVEPATREDLIRLSNRLSALLANRTASEVRTTPAASVNEGQVLQAVAQALEHAEQQGSEGLSYAGIRFIVAQPEFAHSAKLQPVVEALEQGHVLAPVLYEALQAPGVRVLIGDELPHEAIRNCSVVLTAYGPAPDTRGVVGIVGPTRMPYWRAVPLVRFVGSLIDGLMRESFRLR
ncbi:MAG TPA: heat-inducible transcriptional repressor HrcA [Chloroflexota bacterium]|jgi:heat-inducible transcriptional repressor|nr:heat-inducible transcriptional repressor HrcA [Chloroflexota bacterium]